MQCRFFMGLLAVAAMVAVDQYAFGQELRHSVASVADAKGGAQGRLIGTGERAFSCGTSFYVRFIAPILQDLAWEAVTHHPLSEGAAGTPANFTGEKTSWHGFDRF